jgi:hypothetical protein
MEIFATCVHIGGALAASTDAAFMRRGLLDDTVATDKPRAASAWRPR